MQKKRKKISCTSKVRPVNPPGKSPPAWTKVFKFTAINTAAATTIKIRNIGYRSRVLFLGIHFLSLLLSIWILYCYDTDYTTKTFSFYLYLQKKLLHSTQGHIQYDTKATFPATMFFFLSDVYFSCSISQWGYTHEKLSQNRFDKSLQNDKGR